VYSTDCKPEGTAIEILSTTINKKEDIDLRHTLSKNLNFYAIDIYFTNSETEKNKHINLIFDNENKLSSKNTYYTSNESNENNTIGHFLSNNGNFYALNTLKKTTRNKKEDDKIGFDNIELTKIQNSQSERSELNFNIKKGFYKLFFDITDETYLYISGYNYIDESEQFLNY
jgi:hypothetical protein